MSGKLNIKNVTMGVGGYSEFHLPRSAGYSIHSQDITHYSKLGILGLGSR